MKNHVIILLAGNSERFKANEAKQFFLINDKPLIYYTISSFEKVSQIDEIILVSKKEDIAKVQQIVDKYHFSKIKRIVEGGKERKDSVYAGLQALKANDDDIVLIHDGARPIVPEEVILNLIKTLGTSEACTTAIKMEDTIAISSDNKQISSFEDREKYYRIQTPQGFKYKTIVSAHKNSIGKFATDDAQLVRNLGFEVKIVLGDKRMNKITTIEDISNLKVIIDNEHL